MLNGALFAMMEEAGECVLVMSEEVDKGDFLRSRLTRYEVQRRLSIMARCAGDVPPEERAQMPEMPWDGWATVARDLHKGNPDMDELLWFAVTALAPATMMWIEVYRKNQPELFTFTA